MDARVQGEPGARSLAAPVVLRGIDHPELGEVASLAVDPDLAIALTRGRHPKAYRYTDPNEDAVGVRDGDGRTVMVVADGHNGTAASHLLVEGALEVGALRPRRAAVAAVHGLNRQVVTLGQGRRYPRSTLSMVTVEGEELTYAAVGDSPVVLVRGGVARALTRDRPYFLGDQLSEPQVAGALEYGTVALAEGDVVVVVSDGYTNFAPIQDLAGLVAAADDAEGIARAVVQRAGEGGAGDNVAVAVLCW